LCGTGDADGFVLVCEEVGFEDEGFSEDACLWATLQSLKQLDYRILRAYLDCAIKFRLIERLETFRRGE